MKGTKAYQVLKEMSPIIRNRFRKFLESPYHSTNENHLVLFDILNSSLMNDTLITKESIIQEIYKKSYDNEVDLKFRRFTSTFIKLAQEFIAVDYLKSNNLEMSMNLVKGSLKENISVLKSSAISKLEKTINYSSDQSANWYLQYSEFYKLSYLAEELELKRIKRKTNPLQFVDKIVTHLDYFYVAEKLRFMITSLTWKKHFDNNISFDFEDTVIQAAHLTSYQKIPPIAIYLTIYQCETEPQDVSHYFNLKSLIDRHILIFPDDQRKDIIDSSINYSLRRINKGDSEFLNELFENYKKGLMLGTMFANNAISPWTFKNIVSVALRLKNFRWVEGFINEFSSFLPEDYEQSSTRLAKAHLAFYKKDYDSILPLLQEVEFKEISYITTVKSLLMVTYYELDDYNSVETQALSFRAFLNRQSKLSSYAKDGFKNYISFVLILIKANTLKKNKLAEIKNKIQNTKGLASKSWLLEKVDELLGEKA